VTDRRSDGQTVRRSDGRTESIIANTALCIASYMLTRCKNGQNSTKKARNLPVHIVELPTAVVKVDIKVINGSLTQNQCLQCVTLSLMHVEIPRPRDATELNNDGMISSWAMSTTKQNRFYQFFSKEV